MSGSVHNTWEASVVRLPCPTTMYSGERNLPSSRSPWPTPGSASALTRTPTYSGAQDSVPPNSMTWASSELLCTPGGRSPSEVVSSSRNSPRAVGLDPLWRKWEIREDDLVETADHLERLLRCKERYERDIGEVWWGCPNLDKMIHCWHTQRAIFELAIQATRKFNGKEHPTRDLLARIRTYFTYLYPKSGHQI